jgi:hypothetical protein
LADLSESGTGPQIDVKQTATYRALQAVVIILGVLIVMALGVLVAGFAFGVGGHAASHEMSASFAPPAGTKLVSMEVSGDRLILHLRSATSDEVDIVDTQNGHLISRLAFPPAGP